jgi:hypothetical protein
MTVRDFLGKVIIPIAVAAFLAAIFYPVCVENGMCDYRKLWLLAGIPYGVRRMYFWLIPKGFDLGGTIGMFVFNLLIGGLIGGVVLAWSLGKAAFYFIKGIGSAAVWVAEKAI